MKKLILLFVSFLCSITWGQAQTPHLVVWMTNGEKVVYELSTLPKTSFTNTELVISSGTVEVAYALNKVQKYTYTSDMTGIDEVEEGHDGLTLQQNGNVFTFEGLENGTLVAVYAVDGKLMMQQTAKSALPLSLSLKQLPQGVYVIKANDVDYKVIVR